MGPILTISPPDSWTVMGQSDGGTVDTEYLCLVGYMEVVMLRRLTKRHKQHALWVLNNQRGTKEGQNRGKVSYLMG